MRILTKFSILTVLLAATSACNMGTILPATQAAELRDEASVADCKFLGNVTEKTRDRWTPSRNDKRIADEVLNLARAQAVSLGGNTVVEKSTLTMGRQTFAVYSCK